MNAQNPIAVPDAATLDTLPYRCAIDRVATLRALVMRIALTASRLAADPSGDCKIEMSDALETHAKTFRQALQVIQGQDVFADLPEMLSIWMASIASGRAEQMAVISRMANMTDDLCEKAMSDDGLPEANLDDYIALGQGDFFEAVTALTDEFWNQIEDGRATQLERAMQSAARLGEGLSRLERIGKYVRSMSINASVEASRAGEAGKGLAIIAQEFKVLAEEVQQLTFSARQDIESIDAS